MSAAKPVPRRSLDAIFRHVIKDPPAALNAALKDAGYDLSDPQPLYSVETHKKCLELARLHLFRDDPEGDGYRKLGRLWANGFAETLVGSVLASAARVIGTERVLARIPSYMKAGRDDFEISVEAVAPRMWRLEARDSTRPLPELTAGVVESIVRMTGVREVTVTVETQDALAYELLIQWKE